MSTTSRLTISLGEQQLAKLTNETPEIRMRALEQVETRFIRCLQHGETMNLKPVLLLKQLIRWFGFTPPAAADRVLSLMLELLRSDYVNAIVYKIPCHRLITELDKIRKILAHQQSKRVVELLDDLHSLVPFLYTDTNSVDSYLTSCTSVGSNNENEFSIDKFRLSPADYEPAWIRASADDMATMKTIVDSLTVDNDLELLDNLIHLQIKLGDYPVDYLLQPPHIFLNLLHRQRQSSDQVLFYINRSLLIILKLIQRELNIRNKSVYYAAKFEFPESAPQQLCISSCLTLLFNSTLHMHRPPKLELCRHNWHLLQLTVELTKTFCQLCAPIPSTIVDQLGSMVNTMINYCGRFDGASATELSELTKDLMVTRLTTFIYIGLLTKAISLNLEYDPKMDKKSAQSLLQLALTDTAFLSCVPLLMRNLNDLYCLLLNGTPPLKHQMERLEQAYTVAVNQLTSKTPPMELLQGHRQVRLVLIQLGSEKLMEQLCQAIVKCTPFYLTQPEIRQEAESLLSTLFDLPDDRLRGCALRLLKQSVVEYFHCIINNSIYMAGCNNFELARQKILGLPMSTHLLRKILVNGWSPRQPNSFQLQLQQWCIDYLTILLGLSSMLEVKDFKELFKIVVPVLPLVVCRAIRYPQLQRSILEVIKPDANYMEPVQVMRVNACYLFHPDAKLRKEAQTRLAYTLIRHDTQHRYRPVPDQMKLAVMSPDLCVIRPHLDYSKLFSDRMNLPFMINLQTLIRLLKTPDLKAAIRKSSFTQLNVLLHNWKAVEAFTQMEGFNVLFLKAVHDPLFRDKSLSPGFGADLLPPAVGVMLKVLFRSEHCRAEFKDEIDVLHCLLRHLYLHPLEMRMRAELSACIFMLLFHEHITPTEEKIMTNVDLSALLLPFSCEVDHSTPPTAATEGVALQDHLVSKFFAGNMNMAAQHWRLHVALKVCGSVQDLKLSSLQALDIAEPMKLRPTDLALVQSSLIHAQLQNHLMETSNCSNHEMLHTHVASIQLFLVLLGNDIPSGSVNNLWKIMHKYLKTTPGNVADLQLYMALLELCINCLRHGVKRVPTGIFTALETDPHHSFYIILRDVKSPLILLQLVTDCIVLLLNDDNYQGNFAWFGKLFMELSSLARTHFEKRNLQHVRCLLRVLSRLSEGPLQLDDDKLQIYYQHFVQLSSNLRTSTQTGAQWQRDCLLVICQLQAQTQNQYAIAVKSGTFTKVLRYLLGLCSHSDGEVRTLAWVTLANWVRYSKDDIASLLAEFTNFLPGGLAASCLSTMMDGYEQMLVREMAARTFELQMPHLGAEACCELFKIHSFLKEACNALSVLQLYPRPMADKEHMGIRNSCEIIGCYVSICIKLVIMQPSWCATLCEHAFIHALSNVMKLESPGGPEQNKGLLELCAGQICSFYALCYIHNFEFLQRTICRDAALIKRFVGLIGEVFEQHVIPGHQVVQLLKLLMVFCKDQNAYEFLCDQFNAEPELLLNLVLHGLKKFHLEMDIQRYSLALLSILLGKVQLGKKKFNLLNVLESDMDKNLVKVMEEEHATESNANDDDKENNTNALNKQLATCLNLNSLAKQKTKPQTRCFKKTANPSDIIQGGALLYHSLEQLFQMLFPVKDYCFVETPTRGHVQICDVIGNILKLSPLVAKSAQDFHLLDYVIELLETFLDNGNVGNATVYVRRVGAHKSHDIISNLLILFHMLMNWHSSPQSVITDPVLASRVTRVIVRVWPWLSHSAVLKQMTVLMATFSTEHSFEMCKQASQVLSGQSHSLLQQMVRVADHETTKKEPLNTNKEHQLESPLEAALRVMINCCSCTEGRLSLGKMRVLDMFDTILPATSSTVKKVNPVVLLHWLKFWEIFSRYEPGYKMCHMPALLNTVRNSTPLGSIRISCLRILRNMSFANINRVQLVAMTEFVNLISDIASQPVRGFAGAGDSSLDSFEEHDLVVLCVWKLFAFSAKNRAELCRSSLFKKLRKLSEQLLTVQSKNPQHFKRFPFASALSNKLSNLFSAVNR